MKIKIIYGGLKEKKNENINLELSLLGLRNDNMFTSETLLSTFEMLKEKLYFNIKFNKYIIKNNFDYKYNVHNIYELHLNDIDDYDYLNSYKNYLFNNIEKFINLNNNDNIDEKYFKYHSDLNILFQDLKIKIKNGIKMPKTNNDKKKRNKRLPSPNEEDSLKFLEFLKNIPEDFLNDEIFSYSSLVNDDLIINWEISENNNEYTKISDEMNQKTTEYKISKNDNKKYIKIKIKYYDYEFTKSFYILVSDDELNQNSVSDDELNQNSVSDDELNQNTKKSILDINENINVQVGTILTIDIHTFFEQNINIYYKKVKLLYKFFKFFILDNDNNSKEFPELFEKLYYAKSKINKLLDNKSQNKNYVKLFIDLYENIDYKIDKNTLNISEQEQEQEKEKEKQKEKDFIKYYIENKSIKKNIIQVIESIFDKSLVKNITYNFNKYLEILIEFKNKFFLIDEIKEKIKNFGKIKNNEELFIFVIKLLLNDQNDGFIFLEKLLKKLNINDNKILIDNLDYLNEKFIGVEKNKIENKLKNEYNDKKFNNENIYEIENILNIKNMFDFKIKNNLINYEISNFFFYINELQNDKIILNEELYIYKQNNEIQTSNDKFDKEYDENENENYLYLNEYQNNFKDNHDKEIDFNFISELERVYVFDIFNQNKIINKSQFNLNDIKDYNKLNEIILYLNVKKYYLHIIFIIKNLDNNFFFEYLQNLYTPKNYIYLSILFKIFNKLNILLPSPKIDYINFYEINEMKIYFDDELKILNKKKNFINENYNDKGDIILKINSRITSIENEKNNLEEKSKLLQTIENDENINLFNNFINKIKLNLYKDKTNFFNSLINNLKSESDYDNFLKLYDLFINKNEYIKPLLQDIIIKDNNDINFSQNLIKSIMSYDSNISLLIFNKYYSRIDMEIENKIDFLEKSLSLLFSLKENNDSYYFLKKYILENVNLYFNELFLINTMQDTNQYENCIMKGILEYYELNKKMKEMNEKLKLFSNVKTSKIQYENRFLVKENNFVLNNSAINFLNSGSINSIINTDLKKNEAKNKLMEINEKNKELVENFKNKCKNYYYNYYFLLYDIDAFVFLSENKTKIIEDIYNLIIMKNNRLEININNILNIIKYYSPLNFLENNNSNDEILINYKNNLFKINYYENSNNYDIICLEINKEFINIFKHVIENNKYQYINYEFNKDQTILKKYLCRDLDNDFNYNINFKKKFCTKFNDNDDEQIYNNCNITYDENGVGNGYINFSNIKFYGKFNVENKNVKLNGLFYNNNFLLKKEYSFETVFFENFPLINNNIEIDLGYDNEKKNMVLDTNEIKIIKNIVKINNLKNIKYKKNEIMTIINNKININFNFEINILEDVISNENQIEVPNENNKNVSNRENNYFEKSKSLSIFFNINKIFNFPNTITEQIIKTQLKTLNNELVKTIINFDINKSKIYIFDCMNLLYKMNNNNFRTRKENINSFFSSDDKIEYLNKNFKFYYNDYKNKYSEITMDNNTYNFYVYQEDYDFDNNFLKITKNENYAKIGVVCTTYIDNNVEIDCYKSNYKKNPNDDYIILQLYRYFRDECYDVSIISNDKYSEWRIAPRKNIITFTKKNVSEKFLTQKLNINNISSQSNLINYSDIKENLKGELNEELNNNSSSTNSTIFKGGGKKIFKIIYT